jgi:glycosyltransferase 2 family protein
MSASDDAADQAMLSDDAASRRPEAPSRWRRLLPLVQVVAILAGIVALIGLVRSSSPALREARPHVHWPMLLLASAVWMASYSQLVQLWSSSLPWWDAAVRHAPTHLSWFRAVRIFFVTNLARYAPGGVWQFAGLAAMTTEAGVSPVAATVAVLLQQLVLLATGFVLILSGAPHFLGAWTGQLDTVSQLILGVLLTATLIVALPRTLPVARRWAERITKRPVPLPAPPQRAFALYVVRAALGWAAYGLAFWLFARSLFGDDAPHLWLAATSYVGSYLLGLIAVFAPGGLVVREGALLVTLQPAIGPQRALLLAIASRMWLVSLEIIGAATVVGIDAAARRLRASASRK